MGCTCDRGGRVGRRALVGAGGRHTIPAFMALLVEGGGVAESKGEAGFGF